MTDLKGAVPNSNDVWLSETQGSFSEFKELVSAKVDLKDWPYAAASHANVLIYNGDMVRDAAANSQMFRALTAEWVKAFSVGPGVIAIRKAMRDLTVVDRASEIFEAIISQQRRSKSGGKDHFAKPGANDRIWNSVEKHCLADPENFASYYGNASLAMACQAWLGDGYQMTAQLNRVNPGGSAQVAHRDYHLGFMPIARMVKYPAHVHKLSPVLTLQGAIAHTDMPIETGPTLCLPYSQKFAEGYFAFGRDEFQAYFNENYSQLALEKGDALFFNPALMHGAGSNLTRDVYRTANLLQISSAFGRAMERVDRLSMGQALYPVLLDARENETMEAGEIDCAIAACAEGYAFPTNLDRDPPLGGLSPKTQSDLMHEALANRLSADEFNARVQAQAKRRL